MKKIAVALGTVGCISFSTLAAIQPAMGANLFRAKLDVSQEVPNNIQEPLPTTSNATGFAEFYLNDAEDELSYKIEIYGLDLGVLTQHPQTPDTGDDVLKVHLHRGGFGKAGPTVFNINDAMVSSDGSINFTVDDAGDRVIDAPVGTVGGIVTGVWQQMDGITGGAKTTLQDELENLKSGNLYANIHSQRFFVNGEIRGQIYPVPEMNSGLAVLGFGALAVSHYFRKRKLEI